MKSGNLNFLEPSGPLQACNGTAFTIELIHMLVKKTTVTYQQIMNTASH